MAITYSAGAGTIITSFLVTQVLGDQTQQTGNNTIVLDNIPSAASGYGGNVGDGTLGIGDSYDTRRIMIGRGGTIQERIVTNDAAGTGATRILTVHEDWDTNPIATTDTVDVYYEIADVEDGGSSGGISFAARTGLWTLSNDFSVGNGTDPAGLAIHGGQAIEVSDEGVTEAFNILNNGYFRAGYYSVSKAISGGVITITANSDDEPAMRFDSGSDAAFLDTLIWAQVATLSQISNGGGVVVYDKVKLLKTTQECELYGDTVTDLSISGEAKTTEIIRVDSSTNCAALVLVDVQVLDSAADTITETITLSGVVFSGVVGYVDVRQNKTWNLINPEWDVTIYTQLTWTGTSTGNELNDKRSVAAIVQQADGTKLQNAVVIVYEGTQLDDLVITEITDVNGYAENSFIYLKHATNSVTTTYGNHALRIFNYGYTPFVASQLSTESFSGAVTLTTDSAIIEATQATAISNGLGITPQRHGTGETDTRPMKVLNYDGGTGSVPTIGETITQGSATGVVVEYLGDAVSGTLVLETWNGTEFTDNQTMTGGTSSFNAQTDLIGGTGFYEEYTWEVDCSSKSLQITYDYLAAKMADYSGSPLAFDAIFEKLHEWGQEEQGQAIYSGGSGYYTERSDTSGSPLVGEGVWLSNRGSGTIAYLTSDSGTTYTPPASYTFSVTGVQTDSEVRIIQNNAARDFIDGTESTTGGVTKAAISNVGSGYTVSDVLTVIGGTGTAATLTVTSVSGGQITGVSITDPGVYSVNPTNPVSVTGGTGTGAQFRLTLSGSFSYTYTYSTDIDVYVVVFHLDFKEVRLIDLTLTNSDQPIPVQQQTDRVYSNL